MIYLFFQTWIWLLVAVALGLVGGWLIWGRNSVSVDKAGHEDSVIRVAGESPADYEMSGDFVEDSPLEDSESEAENQDSDGQPDDLPYDDLPEDRSEDTISDESVTEGVTREIPRDEDTGDTEKLMFVAGSDSTPDDLKRIRGIGPVLEKVLNKLGIYYFHQIASFSREDIDRVDDYLSFSGRIDREDWVGQAKKFVENE